MNSTDKKKPSQYGYRTGIEFSESYAKFMPNNCAVIERTADGISAGVCTFHLNNGICPRHGLVKVKTS